MIRGDFSQLVTIEGVETRVANTSIRESVDQAIPQIDFEVTRSAQPLGEIGHVRLGAEVVITQQAQGRARTWRATIEEMRSERHVNDDVLKVQCAGEAERLTRERFTDVFEDLEASEIITEAMSRHGGGTGISAAGVERNRTKIGTIVARQETLLDVISRVASRVGWAWRVEDGVLEFFDPESRFAPFDIRTAENLAGSTLSIQEDLAEVRNVIKGEAWEYTTHLITRDVQGCVRSVYGDGYEGEVVGTPEIVSPDELKGREARMNAATGELIFQRPLVLPVNGDEPVEDPQEQSFTIVIEMVTRRKLLLVKKDVSSIEIYGERHSNINPDGGGDNVATVFRKLEAEIAQKAFPVVTGMCQVLDFGLRAGDWVSITPGGDGIQPASMRVSNIRHTVNGADLQIDVELSARRYTGGDAVPELADRVENLEKRDLDPRAPSGIVIRETGEVSEIPAVRASMTLRDQVSLTFTGIAQLTGGGSLGVEGRLFAGGVPGRFTGGGEMTIGETSLDPRALARFAGGGELTFEAEQDPATPAQFTGGGQLQAVGVEQIIQDAAFTGDGRFEAEYIAPELAQVRFTGGGQLQAEKGEPITRTGVFTGGGEIPVTGLALETVRMLFTGGGQFDADRLEAIRQDASYTGGGQFIAERLEPIIQSVTHTGGGEVQASLVAPIERQSQFTGGGEFGILFELIELEGARVDEAGDVRELEDGTTFRIIEDD